MLYVVLLIARLLYQVLWLNDDQAGDVRFVSMVFILGTWVLLLSFHVKRVLLLHR